MRLEYLPSPSPWRQTAAAGLAILAALGVAGLVFWAYGVPPLTAYATLLRGTLADPNGWAEVLRRAIPLILVGAGLALAFRAQFYNIGAEGQIAIGATAAAGVALFWPLEAPWMLPAMFLVGFLAGAAYALVAALLRAGLGVNEILTTLMLNYTAYYLVQYLVQGPWRGRSLFGFAFTDPFPPQAVLPTLPGTLVHWPTLVLGVLLALLLQFLLSRTTLGFRLRVVGANPQAARYAGIPVGPTLLVAGLITGGLAGLAGVGEVAGIHKKLLDSGDITLGYGFSAIIVAYLARGQPAWAILTAFLMAVLFAGGDVLKVAFQMPFRVVDVFSGLFLLFLIASDFFAQHRVRWGR